jgi:hypothetical protein
MAGFEPACLLLPKQAGWPDSPTSRGAPGEIQTPVLLGRNQALLFAELRGRDTDGQSRTDTVQGLSLVPLPVGLRRREGGVGGSRTLASDRAKIAGCPQRNPTSRLRRNRTFVSRASTGRLHRLSYQSIWRPARESNPRLRRCRPPDEPLSYLATWIGEKDSNPHCLVQSEIACRLADPRMTSCVARSDARPSRSTAPVTFQPSVPPSRWGCLFPLGPATTGRLVEAPGPARIAPLCESSQAAPGFPGLPGEDSNLPIPPGGPVRPPTKKGDPLGRPRLSRRVYLVVPSRWRPRMSRGQHEPIHNIEK